MEIRETLSVALFTGDYLISQSEARSFASKAVVRGGGRMDWKVVEFDPWLGGFKIPKLQERFSRLMQATSGGPVGAEMYEERPKYKDGGWKLYFNPQALSIEGVDALLEEYRAKPCDKPTELLTVLVNKSGVQPCSWERRGQEAQNRRTENEDDNRRLQERRGGKKWLKQQKHQDRLELKKERDKIWWKRQRQPNAGE